MSPITAITYIIYLSHISREVSRWGQETNTIVIANTLLILSFYGGGSLSPSSSSSSSSLLSFYSTLLSPSLSFYPSRGVSRWGQDRSNPRESEETVGQAEVMGETEKNRSEKQKSSCTGK
jgi:hypothetical protein